MKKILPLLFIIAIACSPQKGKEKTKENLPNIIMIVGDDQGYPYFGFMGADYVETPNMDKLAESGTLFKNGYVPDNHCRPSLQTLMTSTLPIQYNQEVQRIQEEQMQSQAYLDQSDEEKEKWQREFPFHAMKNFQTLPKILSKKGYASFQGGKWWEFNYQNGGFTHGMTSGWTPEDKKNGGKWFKQFMGGQGLELARATMEPVYEFIDQNNEEPFFLWFAPELPHYPFDAPDKYYNIYKDEEMTESAKRYYANCTWFDDGVGALMDYLKEKGEFDNTLFIYVNDNGWEQNPDQEFRHDSLRWHNGGDKGKLSLFDQSFRTPIIFSWKDRIPSNTQNGALIHSADIPATLLDYLGMEIPETYFGTSFKATIDSKVDGPRNQLIGNITQTRWEGDMMGRKLDGYWLRNKDWFFSYNATDNVNSLFDMNNDPFNDENLADENPELVAQFSKEIENWKKEMQQ